MLIELCSARGEIPGWLDEGLAEYVSFGARVAEGGTSSSPPDPNRFRVHPPPRPPTRCRAC